MQWVPRVVVTIGDLDACAVYKVCVLNLYRGEIGQDIRTCVDAVRTLCPTDNPAFRLDDKNSNQAATRAVRDARDARGNIITLACLVFAFVLVLVASWLVYRRRVRVYRSLSLLSMCEVRPPEVDSEGPSDLMLQRPYTITHEPVDLMVPTATTTTTRPYTHGELVYLEPT